MRYVSRYWHFGAILLVVVFFAFVRFRLRDVPLERDEGEYAYMGQLILQGIPPYKLAYNMKLPGTYAAYAAILAIFGETPAAIHFGLLVINAATVLLVYLLGARLFGRLAGVAACACYALLSAGQAILGTAAHATHFVVLPALGGILALLRAVEHKSNRWLLTGGVLTGTAFVMKQPGIFFVLFAALYLTSCELRHSPIERRGLVSRIGYLLMGAAAPFVLTCLLLLATGVFDKFWFWTFSYAREYAATMGVADGLEQFESMFPRIAGPSVLIWVTAGVGLAAFLWDRRVRSRGLFILAYLLFSFLAVCSGLYFRPHYFILLIPAVSILAGLAVDSSSDVLRRRSAALGLIPALLFALAFVYSVSRQSRFFFETDPIAVSRQDYGTSPFPESLVVAEYIKERTAQDAQIAVVGSEPQIYFYSRRHSATGYIYTYSLTERQKYAAMMQQEMIDEIEKARPEYLVFVNVPTSWHQGPSSENRILPWFDRYAERLYVLDGIVDISESGTTKYRWGAEAISYQPRSDCTLRILKRKE